MGLSFNYQTHSTKKRHSSKFGRIVAHLRENGYEADIESSGSEYDSHLNNRNNQLTYFKTQVSFSDNNKNSATVPIIHHELMFVYIVEFLSGKCEDNFSLWQTELSAVLNKILEYQLAYADNNERLSMSVSYMFKVNNRNTRTRCKICSKLTIKKPEWRRCGVFIVNFGHILHLVLVFLLLTLSR